MTTHYDTVISGGRVIDPAQGIDGVREVAIAGDRIAEVAEQLPPHTAGRVVDASGDLVMPGLVDLHAHLFWGRDYFGIDADSLAWRCGVTTWVDSGSAGAFSMPALREFIARRATVRMLAFINISYLGIPGLNYDEYCNPDACDVPLLARVVEENRDFIVGIKVRMGKDGVCYPGLRPLHKAVEAAAATGLPIMCHISGTPPPLANVLALLRPGDIVTHAFTGAGQRLIDGRGRVRPAALRAREAGIRFDVGHGAGSFSFVSGEALARHGFWPDTISTDLHQISLAGPNLVADQELMPRIRGDGSPQLTLMTVMTKFLALGMPLPEVIRATTITPAHVIGKSEMGTLRPGAMADVAILRLDPGQVELFDIDGNRRQGNQSLRAIRTFIAGRELEPRPMPPPLPWIQMIDSDQYATVAATTRPAPTAVDRVPSGWRLG
jgi:dihydroorotase